MPYAVVTVSYKGHSYGVGVNWFAMVEVFVPGKRLGACLNGVINAQEYEFRTRLSLLIK